MSGIADKINELVASGEIASFGELRDIRDYCRDAEQFVSDIREILEDSPSPDDFRSFGATAVYLRREGRRIANRLSDEWWRTQPRRTPFGAIRQAVLNLHLEVERCIAQDLPFSIRA
ncbi:Oidioi.mRNA.OKI2018_I69.YSR.g17103.t1.cds [Oikopleura dioica]|uniref:Oidioi.mRNA.OKI2018_I69.YSR.g17103.t1.cds n=1 Tax=Oikopleura dioica TaxID=34765 RepID=A0ABN7SJY5_OIKDI|nr:Oidioi.mRNA.OKI2018_I69.YSR.g17103.t1.cds [Oikopleura dioica]